MICAGRPSPDQLPFALDFNSGPEDIMDLKVLLETAEYAFACMGNPAGHIVVEFIGGGLEYDGNAWRVDAPLTGPFDVVEVDGQKTVKTIAGARVKSCKLYEVYFWYESGGNSWTPPDWDAKKVGEGESFWQAMTVTLRHVLEERLISAGEALYYAQLPAIEEPA
jgi:hypothetical protein